MRHRRCRRAYFRGNNPSAVYEFRQTRARFDASLALAGACRKMSWFGRWNKGAAVAAHAHLLLSHPNCSTCLEPMYVLLRAPVELAPAFERVSYRCLTCGVEETRAVRRAD